jgi:hypothetical protein
VLKTNAAVHSQCLSWVKPGCYRTATAMTGSPPSADIPATLGRKHLHGQQYTTTPDNWRRIAHIILTGEKGYFDSRVATSWH